MADVLWLQLMAKPHEEASLTHSSGLQRAGSELLWNLVSPATLRLDEQLRIHVRCICDSAATIRCDVLRLFAVQVAGIIIDVKE